MCHRFIKHVCVLCLVSCELCGSAPSSPGPLIVVPVIVMVRPVPTFMPALPIRIHIAPPFIIVAVNRKRHHYLRENHLRHHHSGQHHLGRRHSHHHLGKHHRFAAN